MARKEPTVPLNVAEFLRVTLQIAKQSHSLDSSQKQRIGMVLAMYEVRRDEWLLNQGYTQQQICGFAESAALALANHFEDCANETTEGGVALLDPTSEEEDVDFTAFEEEFNEHTE